MTVAVKYCGGCNPRFDRGAFVDRLRETVPAAEFVSARPGCDFVLVVCGCPSRCADHQSLEGTTGKAVVCGAEEFDRVRRMLLTNMAE